MTLGALKFTRRPADLADLSKNKVLVGVATYSGHAYCRKEFIEHTQKLACGSDVLLVWNGVGFPKNTFPKDWTILNVSDEGLRGIDILEKKHNMIREYFLDHDYSHLFMLESDTFPPVMTIERFLDYDKDIISAVYFIKGEEKLLVKIPNTDYYKREYRQFAGREMFVIKQDRIPSIWIDDNGKSRLGVLDDILPQRGLVKILAAGVGSVLIKREVLERVERFRIEAGEIKQFTDFLFYYDARQHGFTAYMDTDTIAQHIHPVDEVSTSKKWFDIETLEEA